MAGALVLLFAASQGSGQTYADNCQTCDFGTGEISLRVPLCLASNVGDTGNSHCQTHIDWDFMHLPKLSCLYLGNVCYPSQPIRTYYSYWATESLFGFLASGYGFGPDGTDWCAVWGMPEGCT